MKFHSAKDKRYSGNFFNYLIAYDYMAGRHNVYNVFILTEDDPVSIGRELPLNIVRNLIKNYEREAKKNFSIFYRKDIVRLRKTISMLRKQL